jgi:hypothetical protein
MQAGTAAVLAFRYGSVLLELLGGVLGCAGQLHDAFNVEVQHLMAVPQVSLFGRSQETRVGWCMRTCAHHLLCKGCCSEAVALTCCQIVSIWLRNPLCCSVLPQVEAKLVAAAAACGCGVLAQLNQQLLARVLTAVSAADPFRREEPQHRRDAGIQQLRPVGGVMKVQN